MTGTPIYTRTGDDGTTGLLFGGRTSKADPLIEVCGTIDEAVAALGLARATGADPELHAAILECQRGLFVAAGEAGAPVSVRRAQAVVAHRSPRAVAVGDAALSARMRGRSTLFSSWMCWCRSCSSDRSASSSARCVPHNAPSVR